LEIRYVSDPVRYARMTTEELRATFLLEGLLAEGELNLVYTDLDRAVVGGATPLDKPLALGSSEQFAADYFCERRELGIINIGARGSVVVDREEYSLERRECLYVGRGSRVIEFTSDEPDNPARFYLLSYPAHTEYPTTYAALDHANTIYLGSDRDANQRTIYQYIHQGGIQSCQLVMGFTELVRGSVWNTMPPHTHARRTEIYFYFDVPEGHQVLHLMGRPDETRSLWVPDRTAVISPRWSLHTGVGTAAYTFIWGMGGENQAFDDMDGVNIDDLR